MKRNPCNDHLLLLCHVLRFFIGKMNSPHPWLALESWSKHQVCACLTQFTSYEPFCNFSLIFFSPIAGSVSQLCSLPTISEIHHDWSWDKWVDGVGLTMEGAGRGGAMSLSFDFATTRWYVFRAMDQICWLWRTRSDYWLITWLWIWMPDCMIFIQPPGLFYVPFIWWYYNLTCTCI